MGFALPGDWVWDFWSAVDGDQVPLFYLHAPRSLGDPELRHHNASIGHAVTRDLTSWEHLPAPLPERRLASTTSRSGRGACLSTTASGTCSRRELPATSVD